MKQRIALGVVAGVFTLAAIFRPGVPSTFSLPPCPFYSVTGLFCPGCGTTRALGALLHGDAVAAMAWNPLLVIAIPLLLVLVAMRLGHAAEWKQAIQRWAGWMTLSSVVIFTVARNLPWKPFVLLAPGGLLR